MPKRLPVPTDPAEVRAELTRAQAELARWQTKLERAGEIARSGEGRWYQKKINATKKITYWKARAKRLSALLPDEPEPAAPEPISEPEPVLEPVAEPEAPIFDQTRIFLEWQVQRGTRAWAPWGDTGWSAVVVGERRRTRARVSRVNPRTNEGTARGAVRCDELVRRDPELKGRDRPAVAPSQAFEGIRRVREQMKQAKRERQGQDAPGGETEAVPVVVDERPPEERLKRLLELTEDCTTADDW